MSGLNWISYHSTLTQNDVDYTRVVNFFKSPPASISSGTLTSLQIVDTDSTNTENPLFKTFTNAITYTAVQFKGYFNPPVSAYWTFNIGGTVAPNTVFHTDDVGIFFLGPPHSTLTPSNTYTSLSTTPSTTQPIIYNYYNGQGSSTSSPIFLTSENLYPILFYYNQTIGGYSLGLSFSSPSYNNNAVITNFNGFIYSSIPYSNVCFVANTPIQTNKGIIPIQNIDPSIHLIQNKKIIALTQTISILPYLICFEKNALGKDYPSQKTIMSQYHKVLYKGIMTEAYRLLKKSNLVYKIKYNGEILYNIVMGHNEKIRVNHLICETLHPNNIIAKLYSNSFPIYKDILIHTINEYIEKKKNQKINIEQLCQKIL